jgi:MOSC domain-containing protein YiiM
MSSTTALAFFFSKKSPPLDDKDVTAVDTTLVGKVVRLAAREYHPDHSKPSSRQYTTQKVEQQRVNVTAEGIAGDYNHYRSVALDATADRAVSILTTDSMEILRAYKYPARNGDLGENILVSGVTFSFFEIGQTYRFCNSENDSPDDDDGSTVIVEITEPCIACANLCKLPYINDEKKVPKERLRTCQEFLQLLDEVPGRRGWYAKVLQEGTIVKDVYVCRVNKQ